MSYTFTVEQGIRVQRQQLAEWKSVLRPEAYDALVEYATRDNARAKDGHDICRGTSLSGFIQGLCYVNLIKENLR